MNFIKRTSFLSFVFMLVMSTGAQAGRQGINFFYGLGITGLSSSEKTPEFDAAGGGEVIVGFEEDGWAVEYSGFKTLSSGTNTANVDYAASITQLSLAYRTIEKGKMYYKIKAGQMTADFNFTGATATAVTDGNFVALGIGMRTGREARVELEYSLYSSDTIDNTHMFTLRYLFGGAPSASAF